VSIWETILAGLAVAGISGSFGFLIKSRFFTKNKYLPTLKEPDELRPYTVFDGTWHEYHFTFDPKVTRASAAKCLVHAEATLSLERDFVVTGVSQVKAEHRRGLRYAIRGQIRSGNFYYTAICIDDPSDAYAAMFSNLLDEDLQGTILGWDYSKTPYAGPLILCKHELSSAEAEERLNSIGIRFFGATESQ
jgi:hypothetical protein